MAVTVGPTNAPTSAQKTAFRAAFGVENAGAVAAHEAAPNPHPQYTTTSEAAAAAPVQSVAGRTGAVVLTKGDVGLGSVDNTSDANKPISTATQTALDGKADSGHTHALATTSTAGFMSAADKTKLDGFDPAGGAAAVAAHEAAADPHPQYAVPLDVQAGYLPIAATTYDSAGLLESITYAGGCKALFSYTNSLLTKAQYTGTDGITVLLTIDYTYNLDGTLATSTRSNS